MFDRSLVQVVVLKHGDAVSRMRQSRGWLMWWPSRRREPYDAMVASGARGGRWRDPRNRSRGLRGPVGSWH
ncbi:hypothetical protein DDJ70_32245 [Klebsiella michiganensis]|nr:hypothetical protein DDJ70_32245 [Klebsiella michiganensis]